MQLLYVPLLCLIASKVRATHPPTGFTKNICDKFYKKIQDSHYADLYPELKDVDFATEHLKSSAKNLRSLGICDSNKGALIAAYRSYFCRNKEGYYESLLRKIGLFNFDSGEELKLIIVNGLISHVRLHLEEKFFYGLEKCLYALLNLLGDKEPIHIVLIRYMAVEGKSLDRTLPSVRSFINYVFDMFKTGDVIRKMLRKLTPSFISDQYPAKFICRKDDFIKQVQAVKYYLERNLVGTLTRLLHDENESTSLKYLLESFDDLLRDLPECDSKLDESNIRAFAKSIQAKIACKQDDVKKLVGMIVEREADQLNISAHAESTEYDFEALVLNSMPSDYLQLSSKIRFALKISSFELHYFSVEEVLNLSSEHDRKLYVLERLYTLGRTFEVPKEFKNKVVIATPDLMDLLAGKIEKNSMFLLDQNEVRMFISELTGNISKDKLLHSQN